MQAFWIAISTPLPNASYKVWWMVNDYCPSKLKTFVWHLYNVGPTSLTLDRHCTNAIQMFCVCWGGAVNNLQLRTPKRMWWQHRLAVHVWVGEKTPDKLSESVSFINFVGNHYLYDCSDVTPSLSGHKYNSIFTDSVAWSPRWLYSLFFLFIPDLGRHCGQIMIGLDNVIALSAFSMPLN